MSEELTIQFLDEPKKDQGLQIDFVDKAAAQKQANFGLGLQASLQAGVMGGLGQFLTRKVGEAPAPTRAANGIADAWEAGVQQSASGLLMRGKMPDVVLDPQHKKWHEELIASAGQLYGDFPFMLAGGALAGLAGIPTGPGAVAAGGAAAFATPTALRKALIQAYTLGEVESSADFLSRTGISVMETVKDAEVGALTSLTGMRVSQGLAPGTSRLVAGAKVAAAETGTMTVAPALLEGRLPEPQEFVNAAIMVGGLHAVGQVTGKMQAIYEKTGLRPEEVLALAEKDPTIKEDLLRPVEPKVTVEFQPAGESTVTTPDGFKVSYSKEGKPQYLDTRGSGVLLHGTSRPIESLSDNFYTTQNIYGQGFYTTDGLDIAQGYSKKGRGGEPTIYTASVAPGVNGKLFNMESPLTPETKAVVERAIEYSGLDLPTHSDATGKPIANLREMLDELRGQSGPDTGISADTIQEVFYSIQEQLTEAGYRGYEHLGGLKTGKPAHTVRIFWFPEQDVSIKPADLSRFELPKPPAEMKGELQAHFSNGAPDSGIPRALEPLATAQAAVDAVPGLAPAVGSELMFPRMEVPGEPQPTHVNYQYLNTPDHVNAALARMSELNLEQIQKQRRGTVPWEQTQREAGTVLDALLGSPADMSAARVPGTPAGAAELLARKQLIEGSALDMAAKAKELMELGTNATPEQQAAFLASIDRTAMIQAEFLGARAEAGRALNILKETKVSAERAQQIKDLISRFGEDPIKLAERIAAIEDPAGLVQTAGKLTKATTWQKLMEGYSAFLVSGPFTQVANILGNTAMTASRPFVDLAAATGGAIFRADNPVHFSEAIYRAKANILSLSEGLKLAREAFLTGSTDSKIEHKQAIEGNLGHVIRTPFRALDAMDVVFKYMNERGEALALGAKSASEAGLTFGTREFYEHASQFANNPPEKAITKIEDFGKRMTFKTPLGEAGQKFNALVTAAHLEWMFPFRMTPANVFKEMVKMSPAAPLSSKWRADFEAGGPAQAKAIAEMGIGSAMAALGMSLAFDGHISGGGDPDPNKRRVMAPGWQPYSVKIGNTWYSYQRIQPFGTLIGMAADMADAWKHMTPDERDKVPKILTMAFANGITNQTFLQGLTQVVDAISQPDKKGERFVQNLVAGATVPAAVSQTATMMDPYKREVSSILEAVQSRIPGARESLMPQRDPFGQPIVEPDRIGFISPITTKGQATDKVLIEAGRLADIPGSAVSAAKAPKEIQIQAAGQRDIGRVELTPEQRDVYALEAGTLAHQVLTEIVNDPSWDQMSDMQQSLIFRTVFQETRKYGEAKALPPEQRQKEVDRIVAALENRINKPHKR